MSRRALRPLLLLLPALVAWGAGPARAEAQQPPQWGANVTVGVSVAPPPILLETTRNLYFGSVGPGMTVTVPAQPPYAAGTWSAAARFSNLSKTVQYGVSFVLPTQLVSGTGATMPVSWNGTQFGWLCVWNFNTGTPGVCAVQQQAFSPAAHTSAGTPLLIDLPNNTPQNQVFVADVYVGGQLTVPAAGALPPGVYTAPLRITVARIN